MFRDACDLEITCASEAAARSFDNVIDGYVRDRNDTSQRLKALLNADADCVLAHVMRGCFTMGAFNAGNDEFVGKCLAQEQKLSAHANERERMHIAALEVWHGGDADRAMTIWEEIGARWPRDILAFRLHHFLGFWRGQPERMMAHVERMLPHWSRDLSGFATIQACRSFAHEESGSYVVAEHAGFTALDVDPGDIWATHAIAHTYEMQGRRGEALNLLHALEGNWDGGNNLLHHLWWHEALFRYDRGDFDAVLALYDERFRNLDSELTQQMPDLYIDVQNAVSMLYRLEKANHVVGERWEELAQKAAQRGGDCSNAFTLPHWMLALVRTARFDAAERLVAEARLFAAGAYPSVAGPIAQAAIPCCEAILADARGSARDALAVMRPALGHLHRLGGSHAQQDLLERIYADIAMRAGSEADVRLIVERVRAKRPAPLEERTAWRDILASVG